MWPNVDKDGRNPNELVARISLHSPKWSASVSKKVVDYLDRCIATSNHKKKPGPEYDSKECVPWRSHGCCSANTTSAIKKDGALTLFNRKWNHCGNLSDKCREFFIKNTCFYSCSPNLAPWIVNDPMGGLTRTEKFKSIPLCSDDCDAWFDACKNDMTCSNDWSDTWKWTDNDKCDKQKCTSFKDYFTNSMMFCNKIFDHTYKYTSGKPGRDCMNLWPDSGAKDLNLEFASTVTRNIIASSSTLLYPAFMLISSILWAVVLTV
ncbi:folate receptor beta-like [Xenia sp. Carnegie-2017]|uniref:folate receptor beta-like n=1 Tax=Xenia sp. Carnegie-2017 TaxID=2897299 RepID=UPI001F04EF82|nr:folate receptor beta-like [Xenia sp. Carnegie-2017]